MQIFVLDKDPIKAAKYHMDKHVIKQILESAQLLCTSIHEITGKEMPYRPTHAHHPCCEWLQESPENMEWLSLLGLALGDEKKYRYGGTHKSLEIIDHCIDNIPSDDQFENGTLTPFRMAMDSEFITEGSVVKSYRNYYREDKKHLAEWTKRGKPNWW